MHCRAGGGRGGGGNLPLNLCEKILWGQPIRGWVTLLSSRLVNPLPHDNSRASMLNEGVSSHPGTRASLTSGLCPYSHKTHGHEPFFNNDEWRSLWKDATSPREPSHLWQYIFILWAKKKNQVILLDKIYSFFFFLSPWRFISMVSSYFVHMCVHNRAKILKVTCDLENRKL